MKQAILRYKDKDIPCNIPESWEEVTCSMMARLQLNWDQKTTVSLFAAICGLDIAVMGNVTKESGLVLYSMVAWVADKPIDFAALKKKKTIEFHGKTIQMPKSIDGETIGQYEIATQVIESTTDIPLRVPKLVAIYLQKAVEGTYNHERVAYFEDEINNMPAKDIYPVYDFFFRKLKALQTPGLLDLLRSLIQIVKRSKLISMRWRMGRSS